LSPQKGMDGVCKMDFFLLLLLNEISVTGEYTFEEDDAFELDDIYVLYLYL
jgi:hypothetical protein